MSLESGHKLGHYEILEPIGSGGMGDVYRARDSKLGRDVAIKVLPREAALDSQRLRRFEQEARAASALNHPNIVTIYEIGEQNGTPYIVMELVDGVTLRDMLAGGALSNDKLIRYGTQIAEGLAKAHQAGIVHRDLKPDNIIISDDGYIKILDFGLAKLARERGVVSQASTRARDTTPGEILGTVGYMSPEQAKGDPVDFRSDQFSLGAMLYEMATGSRAFQRPSSAQTLAAIIEHDPPPVTQSNPSVPGHLASLIDRCLTKEPSRRFSSTWDIAKGIHAEALVAPDPPPDRRPLAAAAAVGLLAIIVIMILGLFVADVRDWVGDSEPSPRVESIAVLPLQNLSGDRDQDYFADAMTDALIANLGKVEALKVISRTSSMRFKGSAESLPNIARELGVESVLEGSAFRIGDEVRLSLQLIEAESDQLLWSEVYERDFTDVLALQEEVARAVVSAIEFELTAGEAEALSGAGPVHADAHEKYILGRAELHQRSVESFRRAIALFQESIELDPTNALPYAGLAEAYVQQAVFGFERPADVLPEAERWASRALELDPNLSEARSAMGRVYQILRYDFDRAEREFREAIRLRPGSPDAHVAYGTFLALMGRNTEGLAHSERALELDPLSVIYRVNIGYQLCFARRFEEANSVLRRVIESEPNYPWAHLFLSESLAQTGDKKGALEALQKTFLLLGMETVAEAFSPAFHGGDYEKAMLEGGRRAEDARASGYIPPPATVAGFYAEGGDKERALDQLELAFDDRNFAMSGLRTDEGWDSLRNEPRFQDLIRRIYGN